MRLRITPLPPQLPGTCALGKVPSVGPARQWRPRAHPRRIHRPFCAPEALLVKESDLPLTEHGGEPVGLGKPTGRAWCCGGGPPGEHNVRPADLRTPSGGKGESKGLEPQVSRTGAPALAARKRYCSTKAATPVRSLELRSALPALGFGLPRHSGEIPAASLTRHSTGPSRNECGVSPAGHGWQTPAHAVRKCQAVDIRGTPWGMVIRGSPSLTQNRNEYGAVSPHALRTLRDGCHSRSDTQAKQQ